MKKVFSMLCMVAFGMLGFQHAFAGSFENEYNFDDGAVPEGWVVSSPFAVNTGAYFSSPAESGNYLLGAISPTSAAVVYTPLVSLEGGKACTIEFMFKAPGGAANGNFFNYGLEVKAGTAQDAASQTIAVGTVANGQYADWTECKFTFTPTTSGDYCFSLTPKPYSDGMASRCGNVYFDTFFVSGTEGTGGGTVEPDPEPSTSAFEYEMTFDNSADFTADANIPDGWLGMGAFQRTSAATFGVANHSGEYVLGCSAPSADHALFTPAKACAAGKDYEIEFWYYCTGSWPRTWAVEVYVADENYNLLNNDTPVTKAEVPNTGGWVKVTAKWAPADDGNYCFGIGFANNGYNMNGGMALFDDFIITGSAPGGENPDPDPEPDPVETEQYTYAQGFDADADFAADANCPEGWLMMGTPAFERVTTTDARSGEHAMMCAAPSADHAMFTPKMATLAGEEYKVEFYFHANDQWVYAPAIEVYVTDADYNFLNDFNPLVKKEVSISEAWTKVEATYVPSADGEYCFGIGFAKNGYGLMSAGTMFDDFTVTATRVKAEDPEPVEPEDPEPIELEPNDDNLADCVDLPYNEGFEGENYDGESYLPIGWKSTGTVTFRTANLTALPAAEGKYYMIAYHNADGERDDRAYTPFVNLEAGKEYFITYKLFMQGNDYNAEQILTLPTLRFTVGCEQDAEFHNTIGKFSEKCTGWVPQQYSFIPEVSGPYCFGFMLSGPTNSGVVAIDDLRITSPDLIDRVVPQFYTQSLHMVTDSRITVAFPNHPMTMINASKYADSYSWTCPGAVPETSTDENPSFVFPNEGYYTITLEATNLRGSRSTQREIFVGHLTEDETESLGLSHYNPNVDDLYQMGQTPAFSTHDKDFVTGFNHHYHKVAQRFDFTNKFELLISSLNVCITEARYTEYYAAINGDTNQNAEPFSLVVYGSKEDGSLDENNVLGRIDTTIGKALISYGYESMGYPVMPTLTFEEPVKVKGTFYVAMEFSDNMEIDENYANRGRSYMATAAVRHAHGVTTLYAKPKEQAHTLSATDGDDNTTWYPVDHFEDSMKGIGAYWYLWTKSAKGTAVTAVDAEGKVQFAACFTGDVLNVSGTAAGETINVYNLQGALVATAVADDLATAIACPGLAHGVYVVSTPAGSVKVVK